MRTIHESNYAVIKQRRNRNNEAKTINKKQFNLYKLSSATNGTDALDFNKDHSCV